MNNSTSILFIVSIFAFSTNALAGPKTMHICDSNGCVDRPSGYVSPDPDQAAKAAKEESDTYQGEPVAQLQSQYESGSPAAAYKLGMIYQYGIGRSKINESEAAKYYEFAASAGNIWASYRLATLYSSSRTIPRKPQRAVELYFAAAKGGQPQAANNIGIAYLKGTFLPKSNSEALRWLTIAAEGDIAEAKYNLGLIYLRGEAGDRDLYQGWKWIQSAARSNQVAAQKIVGRIYMTGLNNIEPDLNDAVQWLQPLAAKGDRDAVRWMRQIDRAERAYLQRQMRLEAEAAQTMRLLAEASLISALSPPPTYVVNTW